MTEHADLAAGAQALLAAYATREPIPPLTESIPGLTVEDAYAIQSMQIDAWKAEGREIRGYKVGLTSQAMQAQLGVDQPDYGFLLDGMYVAHGATIDADRFVAPRIEPEIAVTLRRDLAGPGLTLLDVVDAVDTVVGALEIIDSRVADWRISLADTIADNASSAGVVVGEVRLPLGDLDVVTSPVVLRRGDEVVGEGTGAAVLGSPLNAVLWLANRLGELGVTLRAGSLVLPGSVCAAVAVGNGDVISADFGPLGTVEVEFAKEEA